MVAVVAAYVFIMARIGLKIRGDFVVVAGRRAERTANGETRERVTVRKHFKDLRDIFKRR